MATIHTTQRRIKVAEAIEEIIQYSSSEFIFVTEISYSEFGEKVKEEIVINKNYIVELNK